MKPWLFDILACPIDKFFPLELYIFALETSSEDIQSFVIKYKNRDIDLIKSEEIINVYYENEEYFYKDNIVIDKQKLETYLTLILSSIDELEYLYDKTETNMNKDCLHPIKNDAKEKLIRFYNNPEPNHFDQILPELYLVNKFKLEIEIESGILFCSKCKRWYPIVETIPQMLPDKYRDEKIETAFLKNIKNLLDEEFFRQDLKPFNIKID